MTELIIFYIFAAILLGCGIMTVFSRNTVRGALFLVGAFFASTILWLLIETEFLALVLILVYVGAVMTLFLFVVMTLNLDIDPARQGLVRYLPYGVVIMTMIVGIMVYVLLPQNTPNWQITDLAPQAMSTEYSNVKALGQILYTQYAYAFEVAGAILLVAIIAAISLCFRGPKARKVQQVAEQIAVQPNQRVKLVRVKR